MPKVTRRHFLKIGAAGVGLAAAQWPLMALVRAEELTQGGKSVSRTTGVPRQAVASTCLQCPARCGILGFVEGSRLMKIEGNPKDPNSKGRLCAKGQAGISHLYNPDRLLYPVRRTGARGEGKWERITWDEAYSEVAARLRAVRESGRPGEFVFLAGMEGVQGLTGRFLRAFGTPNGLEETSLYQVNKQTAQQLTWGAPLEIADVANAHYILNFGANPYESHRLFVPLIQRLVDGVLAGAKLVTFDPRLSNTAAKSDEWFPLVPGTDGLVALAIAHVIMREGLHDADFLGKWANYPVERLAQHVARYTPEMAERFSGVKAQAIEKIAVEYATTRPATTLSAGGASKHSNGADTERAIALLNALTGNIDVPGGYCLPRTYPLGEPEPRPPLVATRSPLTRPDDLPWASAPPLQRLFPLLKDGQQRARLFMTYMANPVYTCPDTTLAADVLKDEEVIPYYVAMDTYITESAALADLVLPAATYLERWDAQSLPAYGLVPFVSVMQPVVEPQGEAVDFYDVCTELAQRIGGGMERYFGFGSTEAYLEAAVAQIEGLAQVGGLAYLKRHGVWYDPAAKPTYRSYEKGGFATPSGKFELYIQELEERGFSSLPSFRALPTHQALGEDEFILIPFQWNVHTHSRTADCMWLSEIVHDNPVWINSEVARAKGLQQGDRVRIASQAGVLEAKIWLTNGLHPQVLAIGMSVGRWASGRIAQARKFKSSDPNTEHLWWEKHGNGVHPLRLIPVVTDPVGGGQGWMDTRVTLVKM